MTEATVSRKEVQAKKRARVIDLTSKGATVGEIAKDIGATERDVYTFITRNFGGVQKLRDACRTGEYVSELVNANSIKIDLNKVAKDTKVKTVKHKTEQKHTSNKSMDMSSVLKKERDRILSEFKTDIEKEMKSILSATKKDLEGNKKEIVSEFKKDIEKEIRKAFK